MVLYPTSLIYLFYAATTNGRHSPGHTKNWFPITDSTVLRRYDIYIYIYIQGRRDLIDISALAHKASQVALVVKNLPANAEDIRNAGSIPGLGRSPGDGHGNPL